MGLSLIDEPVVGVAVGGVGGAAPVAEVGPAGAFVVFGVLRAEHHGAAFRVNLTVGTVNLLARILGFDFRHFDRALESVTVAQRVTARVDVLLVAHILEHVDGSAIGSGINLLELVDTGGVNGCKIAAGGVEVAILGPCSVGTLLENDVHAIAHLSDGFLTDFPLNYDIGLSRCHRHAHEAHEQRREKRVDFLHRGGVLD